MSFWKPTKANLDQALRERARESYYAGMNIQRSDPALAIEYYQRAAQISQNGMSL